MRTFSKKQLDGNLTVIFPGISPGLQNKNRLGNKPRRSTDHLPLMAPLASSLLVLVLRCSACERQSNTCDPVQNREWPVVEHRHFACRAQASHWIEYEIARTGEGPDQVLRQCLGHQGGMLPVCLVVGRCVAVAHRVAPDRSPSGKGRDDDGLPLCADTSISLPQSQLLDRAALRGFASRGKLSRPRQAAGQRQEKELIGRGACIHAPLKRRRIRQRRSQSSPRQPTRFWAARSDS